MWRWEIVMHGRLPQHVNCLVQERWDSYGEICVAFEYFNLLYRNSIKSIRFLFKLISEDILR